MLVLVSTLICAIASCVLSWPLSRKYPNVRVDTLCTVVWATVGGVSSYFVFYDRQSLGVYSIAATAFFVAFVIFSAIVFVVSFHFRPFMPSLRKRVILVPGSSYLLGGLLSSRNLPKFIVNGQDGKELTTDMFDSVFKFGKMNVKDYNKIVLDFKRNFSHHNAMLNELLKRNDIQSHIMPYYSGNHYHGSTIRSLLALHKYHTS